MPQRGDGSDTFSRDVLFLDPERAPTEFRFDDAVAEVLPDMLRRSVPGYSTLLHLIGVLASSVVKPGTLAYDLGCSLGAVSLSIRQALGARDARIIAMDNSPAMVARCREAISAQSGLVPVDVVLGDVSALELEPTSFVVLNFTLQFVPREDRVRVLRQIADALTPGGVLVLSEKTESHDPRTRDFFRSQHDAFRESNGYCQLEISRKRDALDQFLVPEAPETYDTWLREAGLMPIPWFQSLQFVSWVGLKEKHG